MPVYKKSLKKIILCGIIMVLILVAALTVRAVHWDKSIIVAGGFIHTEMEQVSEETTTGLNNDDSYELEERFQRPSKLPAIKLKYTFAPKDEDKVPPYIAEGFPAIYQSPEDLIEAYYAILKSAANMKGYTGGCGTILWMDIPYPYAYQLFSHEFKEKVSLKEFKNSFRGTGTINLVHLEPAFKPAGTPDNIKYYFTEIEVLKGYKEKKNGKTDLDQPNYFEYYYGIIATEYDQNQGWKIKSVDYLPEIYLCHPLHGWDYFYDVMIDIIYNNWYGMNLKINHTEEQNNYIKVYASNSVNQYRFDFVRLTNGDDVLLHEYVKENDEWKEISILKPDDEKRYKISAGKFYNE
ncbi:hypothetical protein [Aminipila terrae]|uniref:Uncharacterized protein n=1 Tax=Aminipila terrae TaxID=2697030 RepID=A0A6P1MLZ5_9FIRM|nr:hypothetical protein [Aminipila terrae]QHI72015.1 hypothetical protein Ami3637_06035 [Aminipila terrae]